MQYSPSNMLNTIKILVRDENLNPIGSRSDAYSEQFKFYAEKKIMDGDREDSHMMEMINQKFEFLIYFSSQSRSIKFDNLVEEGDTRYKIEAIDHLPPNLPKYTRLTVSRWGGK